MHLQFAPMEGITDAVYRRTHHALFGGVERYMIPFVSPTTDRRLPPREMRALSPEVNQGVPVVPQVLTKNAELFIWLAGELKAMGYTEINLNTGCPSGTVTAKGKGAGMLTDPDGLRSFLDAVFAASPLPVSLKTRIGFQDLDEWPALLDLFIQYPFSEMIIHPRLRCEFYKGDVHMECLEEAVARAKCPVVLSGNLFDLPSIRSALPKTGHLMLGRGLAANPALAREAMGGNPLTAQEVRTFHDALFQAYREQYPVHIVLGKMREVTKYLACSFEATDRQRKTMLKAKTEEAYLAAVQVLFEMPLCENPGYRPERPSSTWP